MRFTLFYRGPLKSNRGVEDKQAIRRAFHPQLKQLWAQPPLADFADWLKPEPKPGDITLIEQIGNFQFAPLVSESIHMVAELNITMLRPGAPGDLVSHAGDLDNRIKTLLDALRVPREATALPRGDAPSESETPFFCLLGDDRLVTHLNISTDSLLEPVSNPSEVVLLLEVITRATRLTFANVGLSS
jgi:hypothetical protein